MELAQVQASETAARSPPAGLRCAVPQLYPFDNTALAFFLPPPWRYAPHDRWQCHSQGYDRRRQFRSFALSARRQHLPASVRRHISALLHSACCSEMRDWQESGAVAPALAHVQTLSQGSRLNSLDLERGC